MNIWNFKGIRERTVDFDETFTRIEGKNASGKTTIATAFFWVLNNTDYDLKTNPPVHPLGQNELTPTVEIIFEIDGKPMRICKSQTMKVTEVNDVRKVANTNTFTFNDVPVSERDLQKKLAEFGFDFSKFEVLANTNSFLSGKKDEMRKMLFGMVDAYTDSDIAIRIGEDAKEAAELLKNYTFDEVKAMQNATLRKINDVYGKKGELLQSKIEGLLSAKVEYDFSALELLKNSLSEQLNANQENRKKNVETQKNLDILHEKSMELQFELSGMKNSLSATKKKTLEHLKREVEVSKNELDVMAKRYRNLQNEQTNSERKVDYINQELAKATESLNSAQNTEFDKNSENCPTCGQKLPEMEIEKLHDRFESEKAKKVEHHEKEVADLKKIMETTNENLANIKVQLEECKQTGKEVQATYTEAINKFKAHQLIPDDEPTDDIKVKETELAEITKKIEDLKKTYIPGLDIQEVELREQLRDAEIKLGQAETNCQIDEKVDLLRNKQVEYEQDRANAEQILYELDLIQKTKNDLLTDDINKHFSLVKWKMYEQLKNGSYTDVCVPMVDGKDLNTSLNNAMQIRAKIDICDSLQKFYDQHIPLFVDNSESLDSENQEALLTETQMILLAVKD
jgi:chromosome segregation ATPase